MANFKPWKILHIELDKEIPTLPSMPAYRGVYLLFWWQSVPLGHLAISADELPMRATHLHNLAVEAITPAVGDHLFLTGFNPSLSEHFATQPQTTPDFEAIIALERPMTKLSQRWSEPVSDKTVSVVICTRDRLEQLTKCLQSLQQLSTRPPEIIVVDNAPQTDATRQLLSNMSEVRYILEPRPGLSVARNTGIRHSTSEIIVFTDDDVAVHPYWLTRLLRGFENEQVMAVTGLVLPAELETESQIVFEMGQENFSWGYRKRIFDQQFFRATQHIGVPVWRIGAGVNMAFRRQIFQHVGGFDERLGAGASGCSEDSELWYRILAGGWHCRYEPTAVIYHYHRRDATNFKHQMRQYMQGHVAALLIQFDRYKHWGNLIRLCIFLPGYYVKTLLKGLLTGFSPNYKTLPAEIFGCIAGVRFYLQNRNREAGLENYS